MYADFAQPELSYEIQEDGRYKILTKKGAGLILATPEEAVAKAEKWLYHLALRAFLNVIWLMEPHNEDLPRIRLTKEGTYRIRTVALYRGNLHYLPPKKLRTILGWSEREFRNWTKTADFEKFAMNGSSAWAFSVDGACQAFPELEEKLRQNGKSASTGFPISRIYTWAHEEGILLGPERIHPLEDKFRPRPLPENMRAKNNLPKPPAMPKPHEARNAYPAVLPEEKKQEICTRYNTTPFKNDGMKRMQACLERVKTNADKPVYRIGTDFVNRYQFMRYLVWKIGNGADKLKAICTGIDGTPDLVEVERWKELHPDFAREMEFAERSQARYFADQALETVEAIETKDDVPKAKLVYKALMDRAALQNDKFRPRQIIQTEDPNKANLEELRKQFEAIVKADPQLLDVLDVEPEPVPPQEDAS